MLRQCNARRLDMRHLRTWFKAGTGVLDDVLLQLSSELFHEVFEITLRFTTVSKWAYFITLTDFEVPKILLAKYPFAAIGSGLIEIIFVPVVRHRAGVFSSNYSYLSRVYPPHWTDEKSNFTWSPLARGCSRFQNRSGSGFWQATPSQRVITR
jgi:hypothetical protein